MARKTKVEADRTREGLLDAAEQCFAERGVAGASLQQIAQRAGVTRGAIYWHFRDKGAIVDAMWDRVLARAREDFPAVAAADDPLGALRAMLVEHVRSIDASRRTSEVLMLKCEFVDGPGEQGRIFRRLVEIQRWSAREMAAVLRAAVAKAQLPADLDVDAASLFLRSILMGGIKEDLLDPGQSPFQRTIGPILDAALTTLSQQPFPRTAEAVGTSAG